MKARLILLLLGLAAPAMAQDFSYTTNDDNTLTITSYSGGGGAVNIPGSINGLPVTGIGTFAFLFANNVGSVTIPEGVTSIGYGAFTGCRNLGSVLFPSTLTSLSDQAFQECWGLQTVLFPSSITNLGGEIFYDCRGLSEVYFMGDAPTADDFFPFRFDNATVYYRAGTAGWDTNFDGLPTAEWNPDDKLICVTNADNTLTITSYTGPGGEVTIPATINGLPVAGISNSAFAGCWSLASVIITNGASIGSSAFAGCPNLAKVTVGASVTNIAPDAFTGCATLASITVDLANPVFSSLNGVLFDKGQTAILCYPGGLAGSYNIPGGVTRIGDGTFSGCTALTGITIPNTVALIGNSAFASCSTLTDITLPDAVTNIGSNVFSSCTGLTNFTIPAAVTQIGDSAFAGCTGLGSIAIPTGVTCIAPSLFSGCSGLTNVALPATVTRIGNQSFYACSGLGGFVIPDSVTGIGDAAFVSCGGLTNLTIGAGATNIAPDAFAGCTSLPAFTVAALNPAYVSVGGVLFNHDQTTLVACPETFAGTYAIPGNVTNIGPYAFYGCGSITNLIIPNGVTVIEHDALSNCGGLASLTIPASVVSVGDDAFTELWGLQGIYFLGDAPEVGSNLLGYEFGETLYYLPGTSGWDDFSDDTGLPTALWLPQIQNIGAGFGPGTNPFTFNIAWASNKTVVVETCTNLASPDWHPMQTNTLTNGSVDISDPRCTNFPSRFYRVRQQ